MYAYFARVAPGREDLLARELHELGVDAPQIRHGGVAWQGSLETGYRACLWSRIASRVLLVLHTFPVDGAEALYEGAAAVPWAEHLALGATLSVRAAGQAEGLHHSAFAALKVKDAIVDQLRQLRGTRPDVDPQAADVQVHLQLSPGAGSLALDLGGGPLHQRGLDRLAGLAPLKEHLAAAVLQRSGWHGQTALVDPLCGAGTLLLEAAMLVTDWAPGLRRQRHGFAHWPQHDAPLWTGLLAEAESRQQAGLERELPPLIGCDADPRAAAAARRNLAVAGLTAHVRIETGDLTSLSAASLDLPNAGHLVTNPPYGARLGSEATVAPLYGRLGAHLRQAFPGWEAHILVPEGPLGLALGLRAHRVNVMANGSLPCRLLHCHLRASPAPSAASLAPELVNRLQKNLRRLRPWAKQLGVDCYRIYDADLPDYALAIDLYGDAVHVQEYAAPSEIDPRRARARLRTALQLLPAVLEVAPERIFLKQRQRQRGSQQYERQAERGEAHLVHEQGAQFWVNLSDYLDTGLFLSHRLVRSRLAERCQGQRFLNLFGYTGTASVRAALGGARSSLTVDLSHTYLDWADANFRVNGLGREHSLLQADCCRWLAEADGAFDVILLDPPTFSNSKRMGESMAVERDHLTLIAGAGRLLAPGGELFFSCNAAGFRLATDALSDWRIRCLSAATLPKDFARRPQRHHCWSLTRP